MSDQLKLLPALIMLLAGAVTSIITYCVGYSSKSALLILLLVLVVFYCLGTILQKLIYKFEEANKPKPAIEEKDGEGTVVEKDEKDIVKSSENGAPDSGLRPELDNNF